MKSLSEAMRELRADIERIIPMRYRTVISGNVPADVAERLSDQPTPANEEFNEWLDEHVGAVTPHELAEPIAGLLQVLWMAERAEGMDCLNKDRAYEQLKPHLVKLRDGCISRFRDL